MSHHPAYTMAIICAFGGAAGYASKKSIPSLTAGISIGALYGLGGYLIKGNKNYGHEAAFVASTILAGSMIPRAIKNTKPVPLTLSVLSVFVGAYYARKIYEFRVGA
ncbi:transmembrane proteins 14C-domain-containing protein [Gigaspora rosea]|uniref:Transmembrane proteins 14C-domain-containing protein n=1 Tax=Gigaspora rosea TaxID=44941 RepID=A0A397V7I1_9GLOM|nr:transmembrane proteins 14C-domain-containing protein [Gigaspora rosea]